MLPSSTDPERNIVTHFFWDKYDILEKTPFGTGTTHNARGLIIQEVSTDSDNLLSDPSKSNRNDIVN